MKVYKVGGSVRDFLMNRPSEDQDWVVVGARPQDMLDLGFTQVGADFPVFLHPETNQEYALARTERKAGSGYLGFEVNTQGVTLEEDLSRRDLTINAMAQAENGDIIDPFGGQHDLRNKVLRHVSGAFKEDPVRILRIFRFQARFGSDWVIAPETEALIEQMVASGEASHLVKERIWKEASRALAEPFAHLFWRGLGAFGLLDLPSFEAFKTISMTSVTRLAASPTTLNPQAKFAVVMGDVFNGAVIKDSTIPSEFKKAHELFTRAASHQKEGYLGKSPEARYDFLNGLGAFGNAASHVTVCLEALQFAAVFATKDIQQMYADWQIVKAVDTRAVTEGMLPGPEVGRAIKKARVAALK